MSVDRERGFFISGGTLPVGSPSYVERSADRALFEALVDGRFCFVLNSRQVGKSSLSVQTIRRLEMVGVRTAFIDLTRIGGKNVTAEQWYAGLALELGRELNLQHQVLAYWKFNQTVGPLQRLFGAVRDVLLRGDSGPDAVPLVLFIDEIDATRGLPFDADEFFAAVRECFNRRVTDPEFNRLTFCLLGVAVPGDLIRNPATTPFNIGERIVLDDFTLAELRGFSGAFGHDGAEVVERVHFWTGGHPFLTQSVCRTLSLTSHAKDRHTVDEVVRRQFFEFKARDSDVNLADVANIALYYEDTASEGTPASDPSRFRADVLSAYRALLNGLEVLDDESNRVVVVLKLSGIARTDGRRLRVRNRIYAHVFDAAWIEQHMPGLEKRRQRQSFRRGVVRTAAVAGAILAVVLLLAAYAWKSRIEAIRTRNEMDYQLYVADVNSLRTFFDDGDTARMEAVFARHSHSPYRGFEWGFWLNRFLDSPEAYTLDYQALGKREEGLCSADGRTLCLVDRLIGVAAVIDRASHKVLATAKLSTTDELVVALRHRWATVVSDGREVVVRDLISGNTVARMRNPGRIVASVPIFCEHADFVFITEAAPGVPNLRWLDVWDVERNVRAHLRSLKLSAFEPLAISDDGTVACGVEVLPGPHAASPLGYPGDMVLLDLVHEKVLDRASVVCFARLLARTGMLETMLFVGRDGRYFVRDTRSHRTSSWAPQLDGVVKQGVMLDKGHAIVSLFEGGHCVVSGFPNAGTTFVRSNVSQISAGATDDAFVASATSVRVYPRSRPAQPQVVAEGSRVTRYDRDWLNLFVDAPSTIRRVSEADFSQTGELTPPAGYRDYTYNGRWSVVTGADGKRDMLVNAENAFRPFRLPFAPDIWACGVEPDHVACLRYDLHRLTMLSARTGRPIWTSGDAADIQAMWISPDGSRLFVVSKNLVVEVYDTDTGAKLGVLAAHNIPPVNVTFTTDGDCFFTCGGDGRAVLWDLRTLRKLLDLRGNALEGITSADMSPDGTRIVTTNHAGSWQLWDAANGAQLLDVPASKLPLSSAVFCRDGKRIVTAGADGLVRVWSSIAHDPTVRIPISPTFLTNIHP